MRNCFFTAEYAEYAKSIFFSACLACFAVNSQAASTVISGTLTITNHAALTNATSGQSYTLNSDTRTFTNAIANAATQIRVRTNDSAATILLSIAAQAGAYPFADITSFTTSAGTNITFRATNDTALTITLSPTNWGRVTYSTQTVGTAATIVRVPNSIESAETKTNVANGLVDYLNLAANTTALSETKVGLTGTNLIVKINADASTNRIAGSKLQFRGYIVLASPHNVDGAGATFQTTNSLAYFGQALFANAGAASTNYVEYRLTVPEDIDTSATMKLERFKFRLTGTDTNTHSYVISQAAVADSASFDSPTLGQSVTLSFSGDANGASGDVETISNVTLTNWAGNVTAGRLWVIRLARNGDSDGSTNNSYSGPLVISYGIAQ